jgi:hypothetical protein
MPKLKNRPPKLCKDKGYAVVYCSGTRLPMGKWGSREAEKNYRLFLTEWAKTADFAAHRPGQIVFIEDVLLGYLDWAKENRKGPHYGDAKTVTAAVLKLYEGTPVEDFGTKALLNVQKELEETGRFSRQYINQLVSRLRTMLRWGVLDEKVPVSVVETLKCVPPLQKGQTTARETVPRKDVSNEAVEATLPFLKPVVAAMSQVQRLAVMRPCEVCRMKIADIDMSRNDGIWLYCPKEHKNAWRENEHVGEYARIIHNGKPEQKLIAPLLKGKTADQPNIVNIPLLEDLDISEYEKPLTNSVYIRIHNDANSSLFWAWVR